MEFSYCPTCGERLNKREYGQEGSVPYCPVCLRPWFPVFPSAVCVLALNPAGKGLFVTQPRIPGLALVSGFIKPGERAEETAVREIKEETGLDLTDQVLKATHWYERDGVLMHLFIGHISEQTPVLSEELDTFRMMDVREALPLVDATSTGIRRLLNIFLSENSDDKG